jgi:hypothetical protein
MRPLTVIYGCARKTQNEENQSARCNETTIKRTPAAAICIRRHGQARSNAREAEAFSVRDLSIIALLLLLSMGPGKAISGARPKESEQPRSIQRVTKLSRLWTMAQWIAASLSAIVVVVTAILPYSGPWVPTPSDIEARDPADGALSALPFKISSRSAVFPIEGVSLSCYVNLLLVMDADRKMILLRDADRYGGSIVFNKEANYYCDSEILSVRPNGALVIGFPRGEHLDSAPGAFGGPLTVIKLCVSITGSYSTRLGFGGPLPQTMFQWPGAPGDRHWIKAPIAFDTDEAKWIPQDSRWGAAYGLRQLFIVSADGSRHLAPDALLCDWGSGAI